jgi:hypothetical protein
VVAVFWCTGESFYFFDFFCTSHRPAGAGCRWLCELFLPDVIHLPPYKGLLRHYLCYINYDLRVAGVSFVFGALYWMLCFLLPYVAWVSVVYPAPSILTQLVQSLPHA